MIDIPKYIKLIVPRELPVAIVKQWWSCVRDNAPEGNIGSTPAPGDDKPVSLLHRAAKSQHEYIIPMLRDLTEDESQQIVNAWDALYPTGDLDIEATSQLEPARSQPAAANAVENDYLTMCVQLARVHHSNWMRERTSAGWRFGTTVNIKNKTHPLLRPWDDLPARYRTIDQDSPQRVLAFLNDQGYAVVRRSELDSLLQLLHP